MSGIHPVSSKEHMLSPTDIFVVAAHEYKDGIENCKEAAKKAHITAERMSYSVMIKEYSDPRLLRVRAGNTLFTIAAMPHRVGFVRGYNGDTAENYIANMGEFFQAARTMGFDILVASTTPDIVRLLKAYLRKNKVTGIKSHFDSSQNIFSITTGEPRGE
jgi:hypothetical protein